MMISLVPAFFQGQAQCRSRQCIISFETQIKAHFEPSFVSL